MTKLYHRVSLLILLVSSVGYLDALDFAGLAKSTGDVAKVAGKTVKTVVEKVPEIFSPEQLADFAKQSIAGVPLEALAATINKICEYHLFRSA